MERDDARLGSSSHPSKPQWPNYHERSPVLFLPASSPSLLPSYPAHLAVAIQPPRQHDLPERSTPKPMIGQSLRGRTEKVSP